MSPLFGLIVIAIISFLIISFIALVVAILYFTGYKKTAKYILFSLLGIFILGILSVFFSLVKDSFFQKSKIRETLSKSGIVLKDDFEILNENEVLDFEYFQNDFSLKLLNTASDKLVHKSAKNQIYTLVDSTKVFYNEDSTYTNFDTLRIELKDNILKYHRANTGRETPKR
ncbi:hypothetical protein [Chryseobacterium sp. FH1]|uniref:hypothetical protein n=1 Tax=Chryseobacterium sp. FH1 TaxID=1233951 RepID=UPI0004E37705|nr:hypothetical protein [Chryseobacterium sp. FH1]KFC24384.1 hypothetical protein IO90_03550 [Chryseobacterium sp. FH1]